MYASSQLNSTENNAVGVLHPAISYRHEDDDHLEQNKFTILDQTTESTTLIYPQPKSRPAQSNMRRLPQLSFPKSKLDSRGLSH
jgi:hypothetical protein